MTLPLPGVLEIETSSLCNRRCPTCMRNSFPDRERVASWFEENYLPEEVIYDLAKQTYEMGFERTVCLSHYNEPLLDHRLFQIVTGIKSVGSFQEIVIHTNGDLIDEEMAENINSHFDRIVVAVYHDDMYKRFARMDELAKLIDSNILQFIAPEHIPTHYSPGFDLETIIDMYEEYPCHDLSRFIINHKGQMNFCCDDLCGQFDLGTFPETSAKDLWYSEKHTQLVEQLANPGGRKGIPVCEICPRPVW